MFAAWGRDLFLRHSNRPALGPAHLCPVGTGASVSDSNVAVACSCHSPPSRAWVKYTWIYTSTAHTRSLPDV
jgi:hypothetical protein